MDLGYIIEFYKSHGSLGSIHNETRLLEGLYELKIWDKLGDMERQKRRKERIQYYQITFPQEYGDMIAYEEKATRLIDLIISFLQHTEEMFMGSSLDQPNSDEFILFRFRNMLLCEKEASLKHPKLKNCGHVPYSIVSPIIYQLRGTSYYNLYNILELDQLYSEVLELYNKSPYEGIKA